MKTRHIFSRPVLTICHAVQRVLPHKKRNGHIVISLLFIVGGAWIGEHPMLVPHFVWDAGAWTIHAIGVTPLMEELFASEV